MVVKKKGIVLNRKLYSNPKQQNLRKLILKNILISHLITTRKDLFRNVELEDLDSLIRRYKINSKRLEMGESLPVKEVPPRLTREGSIKNSGTDRSSTDIVSPTSTVSLPSSEASQSPLALSPVVSIKTEKETKVSPVALKRELTMRVMLEAPDLNITDRTGAAVVEKAKMKTTSDVSYVNVKKTIGKLEEGEFRNSLGLDLTWELLPMLQNIPGYSTYISFGIVHKKICEGDQDISKDWARLAYDVAFDFIGLFMAVNGVGLEWALLLLIPKHALAHFLQEIDLLPKERGTSSQKVREFYLNKIRALDKS